MIDGEKSYMMVVGTASSFIYRKSDLRMMDISDRTFVTKRI